MRKREQYQKPKAKSKIPTLIIMCVTLFVILAFGQTISWKVASIFEPTVPVTDLPESKPVVPVTDSLGNELDAQVDPQNTNLNRIPSKSGSVISQANRNAAQQILNIISKGSRL